MQKLCIQLERSHKQNNNFQNVKLAPPKNKIIEFLHIITKLGK